MDEALDEWQQALMALSAFDDEIAQRNQQEHAHGQAARERFLASSDG